jgi:hypothetical protein
VGHRLGEALGHVAIRGSPGRARRQLASLELPTSPLSWPPVSPHPAITGDWSLLASLVMPSKCRIGAHRSLESTTDAMFEAPWRHQQDLGGRIRAPGSLGQDIGGRIRAPGSLGQDNDDNYEASVYPTMSGFGSQGPPNCLFDGIYIPERATDLPTKLALSTAEARNRPTLSRETFLSLIAPSVETKGMSSLVSSVR